MNLTKKIILLDRDGVINHDSEHYIKSVDEFKVLPGSTEAIIALKQAGFRIYVITNQSGVGRGFYSQAVLQEMHKKLQQLLDNHDPNARVDGFYCCPHAPQDECNCRKPKPGLINQLAREIKTNLSDVPFVGDSKRDLDAALAANCQPILVKTGNGLKTLSQLDTLNTNQLPPVFDSLKTFSDHVLSQSGVSQGAEPLAQ